MLAPDDAFERSVFLNCPFDVAYEACFEALVFSVLACGFHPRCALEAVDSGAARLERISRIIRGCRYGIHDLSRVEVGASSRLPRFNMPFELGLDIGARTFGSGLLRRKALLVLDAEPYRYQATLSDIAGQDIRHHGGSPEHIITGVRDWLRIHSDCPVPGPVTLRQAFAEFSAGLPAVCAAGGLDRHDLQFADYVALAREWVAR